MALTSDGTNTLNTKTDETIDKLVLVIKTLGTDAGEIADLKLLLLTCFQVYDENTVSGTQGEQP